MAFPRAAFALAAALGCTGASPTPDAADAPAGPRGPAYARTLVRDLNADGRADSAVLVATGPGPDSLDVALTLFVDGRPAHREEWTSDDELIDVADSVRVRPRLDAYVRDRLDAALESLDVSPLDTAETRLMSDRPDDVLASLQPLPRSQLNLSYGYETSVALAWDATRRRFVVLWICC
jgi:hypothetical protein